MPRSSQGAVARPAEHTAQPVTRSRITQAQRRMTYAFKQHVAYRLIALRQSRGMTQAEMAELCGLTTQQLIRCERAIARFPADKMVLVTLCCGLDVTYFFENFDPVEMPAALPLDDKAAIRLRISHALTRITATDKLHLVTNLVRTMADMPDTERFAAPLAGESP